MGRRITIFKTPDGELNIWLNPDARDDLVKNLLCLSSENDHFHMSNIEGIKDDLSTVPYHVGDEVLDFIKVALRLDDWDREFFPHVMEDR